MNTLTARDSRFHGAISAATRNLALSDILHDRSQLVWFLFLREHEHHRRVVEEHTAIVDAIAVGDADGAETAMRAHILSFAENLARQLRGAIWKPRAG